MFTAIMSSAWHSINAQIFVPWMNKWLCEQRLQGFPLSARWEGPGPDCWKQRGGRPRGLSTHDPSGFSTPLGITHPVQGWPSLVWDHRVSAQQLTGFVSCVHSVPLSCNNPARAGAAQCWSLGSGPLSGTGHFCSSRSRSFFRECLGLDRI